MQRIFGISKTSSIFFISTKFTAKCLCHVCNAIRLCKRMHFGRQAIVEYKHHGFTATFQVELLKINRINKNFKKLQLFFKVYAFYHGLKSVLTISPSSPPKSRNNKRLPSSADAFSLSNEYDQMTLAGDPNPLSTNENPRSKCTSNWHGRFYTHAT